MVKTFTALLVVYLAKIPIPGAVIGMLLPLVSLSLLPRLAPALESDALALLKLLPLLFVPAGTGVVVYLDRVAAELVPIAVSDLVSTALTILVTAWVGRALTQLLPAATLSTAPVTDAISVDECPVSHENDKSKADGP
jgi:putative effector of murein hydrolase LrgA (UPF0299 family)